MLHNWGCDFAAAFTHEETWVIIRIRVSVVVRVSIKDRVGV